MIHTGLSRAPLKAFSPWTRPLWKEGKTGRTAGPGGRPVKRKEAGREPRVTSSLPSRPCGSEAHFCDSPKPFSVSFDPKGYTVTMYCLPGFRPEILTIKFSVDSWLPSRSIRQVTVMLSFFQVRTTCVTPTKAASRSVTGPGPI